MRAKGLWPAVFAILLTVTMITGCTGIQTRTNGSTTEKSTDTTATGGQKSVKIQFWNGFTASDGDILREIFDRFNAQNDKGITVEMDIMPWDNLFEKLAPALATGTAPALLLLGSEYIP